MKFKCLDCDKEFKEWEVTEWLNEDDKEDDDGDIPCCPYCGSDNVEDV